MKQHKWLRVVAILVSVAAILAAVSVVLASANAFIVDNFTTGDDNLSLIVPNNSAQTLSGSTFAAASGAAGGFRTAVLTGTFLANITGARVRYSVNTAGRTLGISADTGATPEAYIKWDGTNDPLVLSPSGLGGVDLISTTNTGFVIEVKQDDLPAQLGIRVHSAANTMVYTISLPGNIDANSHIDFFAPFASFSVEQGSSFTFNSVGAITWRLKGADSLDFQVTNYETDNVRDFGDLPEDVTHHYSTTLANNGARHLTTTGLRLGKNVDAESNGQPTLGADGDDLDNNAPFPPGDEEGVTRVAGPFGKWTPGLFGQVNVTVNGPCANSAGNYCYLRGWIDWNGNGYLEPSENVITGTSGGQAGFITAPGTASILIAIPNSPAPACFGGTCYARFRLCGGTGGTIDCDSPDGESTTGEVEDYAWSFGPLAVTLDSLSARPAQNGTALLILGATVALALGAVGVIVIRRRK